MFLFFYQINEYARVVDWKWKYFRKLCSITVLFWFFCWIFLILSPQIVSFCSGRNARGTPFRRNECERRRRPTSACAPPERNKNARWSRPRRKRPRRPGARRGPRRTPSWWNCGALWTRRRCGTRTNWTPPVPNGIVAPVSCKTIRTFFFCLHNDTNFVTKISFNT